MPLFEPSPDPRTHHVSSTCTTSCSAHVTPKASLRSIDTSCNSWENVMGKPPNPGDSYLAKCQCIYRYKYNKDLDNSLSITIHLSIFLSIYLSIYVCMYVCMYIYIYIYIYLGKF